MVTAAHRPATSVLVIGDPDRGVVRLARRCFFMPAAEIVLLS
jgi:hypothetical protein